LRELKREKKRKREKRKKRREEEERKKINTENTCGGSTRVSRGVRSVRVDPTLEKREI
jgi:hypothetical protein